MKLMAILIHVQGYVNNEGDWVKNKASILMSVVQRQDRIGTQQVYVIPKKVRAKLVLNPGRKCMSFLVYEYLGVACKVRYVWLNLIHFHLLQARKKH